MKKVLLSTLAVAVVVGSTQQVRAQENAHPPHQIGLIDMAFVFQEYDKFKLLREDLKAELEKSDAQARDMAQKMQTLQVRMKDLKQGGDEYVEQETKLLNMKSRFEAFRAAEQRRLMRRESEIYKTIYLEVADAVRDYAKYYHYTLILRFSRKGVDDTAVPGDVVQGMNRLVVYYEQGDDVTDKVLAFLNRKYGQITRGAAGTQTGTRRPGTDTR